MAGGIHAKRGFNYQDTVILDLLLAHFAEDRSSSTVRPEGIDDLDLAWKASDGSDQKRFVQVKKPREDTTTNPTGLPWTLGDITEELLPGTLSRLKGNTWEQLWILGDKLSAEARSLVDASADAPTRAPQIYWLTVHRLARSKVRVRAVPDDLKRQELMTWRPPAGLPARPDAVVSCLVEAFGKKLDTYISSETAEQYRRAVNEIHSVLPHVLSRLRIEQMFGSEDEVKERIQKTLHQRYGLDQNVVNDTLYRNLRGFISDISTIPERRFNAEDFEAELLAVWPTMTPIRHPPPLEPRHIYRRDLSSRFTSHGSGRILEAIGISGAGKTTLATEVYEQSRSANPERPVFYIEVRSATGLRDVLIGVAFHLRRYDYPDVFSIAARHAAGTTAHDVTLRELARSLAAVPGGCLLLVDLVDGHCSDSFSRDLRTFVKECPNTLCRLAVFGQESACRHFTQLERDHLGVTTIDIRGFTFEEFCTLVRQSHQELDYERLQDIFTRVTVGRSAGLYARLARSLADAPSFEKMRDLSRQPAAELLQLAERQKFTQLSATAQPAAEKLTCFALPFSRIEAEDVFQDVNVTLAIQELLELGLLRKSTVDTFEMHETVRSGLEGGIAKATRRNAHTALAAHYAATGSISAEVFHLKNAGDEVAARCRARTAFLEGKHWPELYGYVGGQGLVTAGEVIGIFGSSCTIEGSYLFPDVVATLGGPADADTVMDVIRAQLPRFVGDYNWATAMAGAFLALAAKRAPELFRIALCVEGDDRERENAVSSVLLASRHHGRGDPQDLIALFDSLSYEQKPVFTPVLFEIGNRESLKRAFQLIESPLPAAAGQGVGGKRFNFLRVTSLGDVVEFLAAIPEVDDGRMFALQSPLLGGLAPFIWDNRHTFDEHCVTVLESKTTETSVQKAAIRVLVLTGNSRLFEICEALSSRSENPIHGFAALAPLFRPTLVDLGRYEERLLNPTKAPPVRLASLVVLAAAGGDLDVVYRKLCDAEASSGSLPFWDFLFLQTAVQNPFRAALALLDTQLWSSNDNHSRVFVGAVKALGALAVPEATAMLMKATTHPNRAVRATAAVALQEKRSRAALEGLKAQFQREDDREIRQLLAAAISASGPVGVRDLEVSCGPDPNITLWRCIVAGRTRDDSRASELVATATDRTLDWRLRRAAINAAGFQPFDAGLKDILPILSERSTLVDKSMTLNGHSILSWLLVHETAGLLARFLEGREGFGQLLSDICGDWSKGLVDTGSVVSTGALGGWLYNRLESAGWPFSHNAPEIVVNELNTPLLFSAVLRSLRRVGRTDLIEAQIEKTDELWFVTKCVVECIRSGYAGAHAADRLRALVTRSGVARDQRLDNIVEEVRAGGRKPRQSSVGRSSPTALTSTNVSFDEAVGWLNEREKPDQLVGELVVLLRELSPEQFVRLVQLADPENDAEHGVETYVPGISLRGDDHTVGRRQVSYSGSGETRAAVIRPAIVAANVYDLEISWHEKLVKTPFGESYVRRVLHCIAVSLNSKVLYDQLRRYSEDFLQPLGSYPLCVHMAPLIDDRIVPILATSVELGTDGMLESLSTLARMVPSSEIDGVLASLFKRWAAQLEGGQSTDIGQPSHHFWGAFRELTSHPRFKEVKDWPTRLAAVLYSPRVAWFHRQDVARVLERDPRSYIHLERVRSETEDWEHFYVDELELLEQACERLFRRVAEEP